jgi:hypothetical protein
VFSKQAHIEGIVYSEPQDTGGRIAFIFMRSDTGTLLPCITAADFNGERPKKESKLVIYGEHKADLIRGTTEDFLVSETESL